MKLEKHPQAEAIIFDLDGTLSDSLPLHADSWREVCKHYHCKFDESIIPQLTGMPTIRFAERVLADNKLANIDPEEMVIMKQQTFWTRINLLKPHLEVTDMVYHYHGKIPLTVGTGASRRSAELQLDALGLTRYFDAIVTADDVTRHKPEPQTFLRCAELVNVEPVKCHVFEDGELGMDAARTAGMYLTDVRPFLKS